MSHSQRLYYGSWFPEKQSPPAGQHGPDRADLNDWAWEEIPAVWVNAWRSQTIAFSIPDTFSGCAVVKQRLFMVSGPLCAEQVVGPMECFIVLRWCLQDTVESWQCRKCAKGDKVVSAEFSCTMKDNRWINWFVICYKTFVIFCCFAGHLAFLFGASFRERGCHK